MPCFTEPPSKGWNEEITWMLRKAIEFLSPIQIKSLDGLTTEENLCKACKYLTEKQMKYIYDNSGWPGLFHWYTNHILQDYIKNYGSKEADIAQEEAKRLGFHCKKKDIGWSIELLNEAQR